MHQAVERPTPMKVACASGAFHSSFVGGDLTQLEFLDLCAHELACDGVVLDVRHFPRGDGDYLAQIKKMATDRGLDVAAVADDAFFTSGERRMADVLECAVAVGAPLVAGELARETQCAWSEQLARLNAATSLAKSRNVTLALRNAPATFAAGVHDCKRVAKEADSAWLRFGPRPQVLEAGGDPAELASNSVLVWSDADEQSDRAIGATLRWFSGFRGYLALDATPEAAGADVVRSAVRAWRCALSSYELNRT